MNVGDKKHWIIEDVIGAGKRALAQATAFDNPLRLFVEELEGKAEAPEVCPRGATCAGTPKPPSEPFTCMSDDCPLKEARIRRAHFEEATSKRRTSVAALLTQRCVKCRKRVGPGCRTDILGDGLPNDCQCDDPSLGTVPVSQCEAPPMPKRMSLDEPALPTDWPVDARKLWNRAVDCAEFWLDTAVEWEEKVRQERDRVQDLEDSLRKLQDRVADRDRQLEKVVAERADFKSRYADVGQELDKSIAEKNKADKRIQELELAIERSQGKGDAYWRGIIAQRDDAVRRAEKAEAVLDEWRLRDKGVDVVRRYQECVHKLLDMFASDPLPADDNAHLFVERLESLIKHGLLVPTARLAAIRNLIMAKPDYARRDAEFAQWWGGERMKACGLKVDHAAYEIARGTFNEAWFQAEFFIAAKVNEEAKK